MLLNKLKTTDNHWRTITNSVTFIVVLVVAKVNGDVWMSFERTTFQLAGSGDISAEQCAKYSDYYCLNNWETEENRTRAASSNDFRELKELAEANYRWLNWYNINSVADNDACCHYQLQQYWIQGQLKGFSPQEFLDKMSDFNSHNKHLNYVVARYNSSLCVNVIYRLGYGSPTQIISSRSGIIHNERPFIIVPSQVGDTVALIHTPFHDLREVLNFDWFKENYICRDHPEICY
ncbi:uncharacterized protein LOC142350830 [Convolutriloba macropyga]|uniref:uncharacterized protein LOC142350830 n=1 Tax=Convolutriloba macropyga TaxID=536237 RepID=UPI003F51BC7A